MDSMGTMKLKIGPSWQSESDARRDAEMKVVRLRGRLGLALDLIADMQAYMSDSYEEGCECTSCSKVREFRKAADAVVAGNEFNWVMIREEETKSELIAEVTEVARTYCWNCDKWGIVRKEIRKIRVD